MLSFIFSNADGLEITIPAESRRAAWDGLARKADTTAAVASVEACIREARDLAYQTTNMVGRAKVAATALDLAQVAELAEAERHIDAARAILFKLQGKVGA